MLLDATGVFGDVGVSAAAEATILSGMSDNIVELRLVEGYHFKVVEGREVS